MPKLGSKVAPAGNVLDRARQYAASGGVTSEPGGQQEVRNPLLQRLHVIPTERIRPGKYQTRESIDPEKYAQLKHQIKKEGFRHILFVCHDPEDGDYFNPTQGGHIRLQVAQEIGITELICFVEDYSAEGMAKGTYYENQARQDLNLIEEGKLFHKFKTDFGWTQERIAKELNVAGGRSHVAQCMLAAEDPPDIQQLVLGEPTRAYRVITYLRQLNALDEGPGNQGKAAAARAPIIEAFKTGQLGIDEVKIAVDQALKPEFQAPRMRVPSIDVETIRRTGRIETAEKSWKRYIAEVGGAAPSEQERAKLLAIRQEIDALLARQ
jgi:ParB/RepB/Spo0J family partition protein